MTAVVLAGANGWHVADLLRAAAELGITAEWRDFRSLHAAVRPGVSPRSNVAAAGLDLAAADCIIVRTMPSGTLEQIIFRMDALGALAGRGVRVLNPPRALEIAIDKYLSIARIAEAGLRVPATEVAESAETALAAFERLGGDVIVKPLFGSLGRGVRRLSSRAQADTAFREIAAGEGVIYVQALVPHEGRDLRVFVIGGRAVAAMRRIAAAGIVTNIARGATAAAAEIDTDSAEIAVRAAAATGAEVAGVDIAEDRGGARVVLEVNAVPGWRGLQAVTGRDIAKEILAWAAGDPRQER